MEAGPGDLMEFVLIEGICHEELVIIQGSISDPKFLTCSLQGCRMPLRGTYIALQYMARKSGCDLFDAWAGLGSAQSRQEHLPGSATVIAQVGT